MKIIFTFLVPKTQNYVNSSGLIDRSSLQAISVYEYLINVLYTYVDIWLPSSHLHVKFKNIDSIERISSLTSATIIKCHIIFLCHIIAHIGDFFDIIHVQYSKRRHIATSLCSDFQEAIFIENFFNVSPIPGRFDDIKYTIKIFGERIGLKFSIVTVDIIKLEFNICFKSDLKYFELFTWVFQKQKFHSFSHGNCVNIGGNTTIF